MKWIKTLKFRLMFTMMALVLLTILIITMSIVSNQRQAIEAQARQELTALGRLLVTNSLSSLLFNDEESARQTLLSLQVRPDINRAVIFDENARRFAEFQDQTVQTQIDPAWINTVLQQDRPQLVRENKAGLHLVLPMISHGELIGALYLLDDRTSLNTQMTAFYRVVTITVVIAFFASLLAMLWLISLFIMPVNQLLETIRAITLHKDYRRRAPAASTLEFNQLTDSFNQMISEIEHRGEQLEQANSELEQRVKARTEALETALALANEANQAKAEFLAVMSHEVRTPLNGVIGFAELLKLNQLDNDSRETVELLNDSAQALLALLNQILDFSKLDADKIELEQQGIELATFMRSVVETNRAKADRKGLAMDLKLQDSDCTVMGDALRLRQILNNLIDNAIKFTDKGRVDIDVFTHHSDGEDWLSFEVSDTGSGISPSKLKQIFSPFAQADSSVTRKYGGTGLGLAICAQLIKLMKGHYGVKSEENQGSLFWFKLPLQKLEAPSVTPKPLPLPTETTAASGELILLAEDNEINQSVAEGMLRNLGYEVEIVSNGMEAVSCCMQHQYALILMDYHMPQLGGIDATRQIRDSGEQGPNQRTPIVALTADVQRHVENQFRHAGANDLLIKPFKLEQLSRVVNQWLKRGNDNAQTAVPVIDDTVLEDIRQMSGDQASSLIGNIVELYLQKSPDLIADIHQGARQGDAEQLFRAAHALKSSSANIGAVRVSEVARQLEKLGRENLLEHVHPHLDVLREQYEQATVMLKARLREA
ncbi:ATP-binding protein [uncultured Methylophaga sp.]|uniref:ATP-binding protein n=1 Tax=uncultured Methylophaga sp. TaxID=285271 RepID=UPI00262F4975|nr:ATP-binding protein [uncultured Methylophaga sp.]